ncbi:hypothetical protein MTO96_019781 [Rhipicephalus appendiculatus]
MHYATLGLLILRSIFDSDATYAPSWAQGYIERCFTGSASSVLGRPIDARLSRPVMSSRWSAPLLLLVKTRRLEEDVRQQTPKTTYSANETSLVNVDKLFYRLLCFVQCGDPYGRDMCNDMAGTDLRFPEAFQCRGRLAERRHKCECHGMGHCETHLPAILKRHAAAV